MSLIAVAAADKLHRTISIENMMSRFVAATPTNNHGNQESSSSNCCCNYESDDDDSQETFLLSPNDDSFRSLKQDVQVSKLDPEEQDDNETNKICFFFCDSDEKDENVPGALVLSPLDLDSSSPTPPTSSIDGETEDGETHCSQPAIDDNDDEYSIILYPVDDEDQTTFSGCSDDCKDSSTCAALSSSIKEDDDEDEYGFDDELMALNNTSSRALDNTSEATENTIPNAHISTEAQPSSLGRQHPRPRYTIAGSSATFCCSQNSAFGKYIAPVVPTPTSADVDITGIIPSSLLTRIGQAESFEFENTFNSSGTVSTVSTACDSEVGGNTGNTTSDVVTMTEQQPHDYMLSIVRRQEKRRVGLRVVRSLRGSKRASSSVNDHASFFKVIAKANIKTYRMDKLDAIRADDPVALKKACRFNDDKVTELQCCNRYGESIVHMACRCGAIKCVRYMLNEGVSLRVQDDYMRNPLHDACWTTTVNFDIVMMLVQNCPELLLLPDYRGYYPLQYIQRNVTGSNYKNMNEFLDGNAKLLAKSLITSPFYQDIDKSMIDEKLNAHYKQRKIAKEVCKRDDAFDLNGNRTKRSAIERVIVAVIMIKKTMSNLKETRKQAIRKLRLQKHEIIGFEGADRRIANI